MIALPPPASGIPARSNPGDGLLHPVALAAVSLLIINDHVLKAAMPGILTGKLSDFAGLVFFPLLIVAGWEHMSALIHRSVTHSRTALVVAALATGGAFAMVKLLPIGTEAYGLVLGLLQWPFAAAGSILQGSGLPAVGLARLVPDPTDLLMLPALFLAYWIGVRRLPSR